MTTPDIRLLPVQTQGDEVYVRGEVTLTAFDYDQIVSDALADKVGDVLRERLAYLFPEGADLDSDVVFDVCGIVITFDAHVEVFKP